MRITKDQTVADLPASVARELMRRYRIPHVTGVAAESLDSTESEAEKALCALADAGYLEKEGETSDGKTFWVTTTKGNALAQASFARPITRKTAERHVREINERAREYNADPDKILTIEYLYVFGSYLDTNQPHLGDVDVAIQVVRRTTNDWTEQSRNYVARSGRSFRSFFDELQWPSRELVQHLRNNCSAISITSDEMGVLTDRFEVIYNVHNDTNAIQPPENPARHPV
ncbi:hypothetical protein ACWEK5_41160 [Rhodococcus koreensis]